MIKSSVSPIDTVNYLNELVDADPDAVRALIVQRVPCNQALAHHPTCRVMDVASVEGAVDRNVGVVGVGYEVGFLGVLNGLFGVDAQGWGAIVAVFSGGRLSHFTLKERREDVGNQ